MLLAAATVSVGASLATPAHAGGGGSGPSASTTPAAVSSTPHVAAGGNGSGNITEENGTFFSTNSYFAPDNTSNLACSGESDYYNYGTFQESFLDQYCNSGPQTPSLVTISGNTVGLGYSTLTNLTPASYCIPANATNMTATSTVVWQLSNNGGQSWDQPLYVANSTCTYVNALEPSFAISSTGTIYGAFVQENQTQIQYSNVSGINGSEAPFPFNYGNRSADALGFIYSTTNGTSFTNVSTLTVSGDANIVDPEVATYGDTVYILYENDSNGSVSLPSNVYGANWTNPISLNLIYTTDNGATWSGPFTLPGENASMYYTTEGASIAVNSLGEVGVSYVTNRTCDNILGYCYDYGGSVVVVTSTTNGSSWSPISQVTPFAGELSCGFEHFVPPYYFDCSQNLFEWGPTTSIAFSPIDPSTLYVAWTASYYTWSNSGGGGEGGGGGTANIGYGSALFDAVSLNNASTWTQSIIQEPISSTGYDEDQVIDPTLTVSPTTGEVYVSYTYVNETYCYAGCNPVFSEHTSYWIGESANGLQWSSYPAAVSPVDYFYAVETFVGQTSAIALTTQGPVGVWSEAQNEFFTSGFAENTSQSPIHYYYWDNETYYSSLVAAFPATNAPVVVNFTENGLSPNETWGFTLSGNVYSANTTTIQIEDVPFASTVYFQAGNEPSSHGGWSELVPEASIGESAFFYYNQTVWVNYTLFYGWAASYNPVAPTPVSTGFAEVFLDFYWDTVYGDFYIEYYSEYFSGNWYNGSYQSSPFPWYLPVNTSLDLSGGIDSNVPVSYIFGSGNGSYTGLPSNAVATLFGPINESFFIGALGVYSVTFEESGLPSGTAYSFTFDGTTYSTTAPSNVVVPNVYTGEYSLTNISATSNTAGWEYFGSYPGGEVEIPLTPVVTLNFTTYVDVGASAGSVSLHAVGLAAGDFWQATFNGTTYGSSTPWINLTAHPGTYLVSALPVAVALNDSTAYTPTGFGPSLSVTTGSTYDVNYALSYRVQIAASAGGTVSGLGSHWESSGSALSFHATAGANYNFLGWTGMGSGAYSGTSTYANFTVGGPISETANFQPLPQDRYNLTVTETGLPTGTSWTVDLNGSGYSSSVPTEIIPDLYACTAGAQAQYSFSVPYVYVNGTSGVRYVGSGFPSSTCTTGTTTVNIVFHAQYLVTPSISGPGSITENGVPSAQAAWVDNGSSISLSASPNLNANFDGWVGLGSGSYSGPNNVATVIPTGPVSEVATFSPQVAPPPVEYTLGFQEVTSFVPGTVWAVTVNGVPYDPSSPTFNITGLSPGTVTISVGTAYSPDSTVKYTPKAPPTSWDLTANHTLQLAYAVSYQVALSAGAGGTISPSTGSAYYASGSTVELVATAASGYVFVGWAGSGTGAYTGNLAVYNVTVTGSFSEVAAFAHAPSTSSGSSGSWITSTAGIAVLAVVGLVVGVGAGYVLFGRKSGGGGGASGGGP